MEHFNIVNLFFESATRFPDKAAIIYQDKQVTFGKLKQQVEDTSNYLRSKGIQKGDRVMIFVPMGFDLYRTVLALLNIGATVVFLDEWVNKKRMEACCEIAQCKAFIGIFKARVLSIFSAELRKIPIKLGTKYKVVPDTQNQFVTTEKADTALITFTTGSTGIPKAAKRTHGFLQEQFKALIQIIDPKPTDIDMPVLPIVLLINLGAGCTSVITSFKASKPELMDAEKIVEQLQKHQVTRMVSSPFFVKKLANHLIEFPTNFPALAKIFTGGAPVFTNEAALYLKAFPNTKIEIVYGSTEAEPISSITANELVKQENFHFEKGLKVGFPDTNANVKIIKIIKGIVTCSAESDLNQLELPKGEIGEIIVSGSHVLREYIGNHKALLENKIFIGEICWHRTGDSGYIDQRGIIYLTGRCNTLIESDKGIISPFMYENYFQSLGDVEMGTILEIAGNLTAIIELKAGCDKIDVIQKIEKLGLKIDIQFVSKIPRDPRHNSKIDYEKLKSVKSPSNL